MSRILLDACSIISFFMDEPEATYMDKLLNEARNNQVKLYMSIINYGEVCIKLDMRFEPDKSHEIKNLIKNNLSIQILNLNLEIVETAATIKSKGGLTHPDAIALATCKLHNLSLLTKDSEFKKFSQDLDILFL